MYPGLGLMVDDDNYSAQSQLRTFVFVFPVVMMHGRRGKEPPGQGSLCETLS